MRNYVEIGCLTLLGVTLTVYIAQCKHQPDVDVSGPQSTSMDASAGLLTALSADGTVSDSTAVYLSLSSDRKSVTSDHYSEVLNRPLLWARVPLFSAPGMNGLILRLKDSNRLCTYRSDSLPSSFGVVEHGSTSSYAFLFQRIQTYEVPNRAPDDVLPVGGIRAGPELLFSES